MIEKACEKERRRGRKRMRLLAVCQYVVEEQYHRKRKKR